MANSTQSQSVPTNEGSMPPPTKSANVTTVEGSSGKGKWLWLLLVVIVGVAAAGGTYYYMNQREQHDKQQVEAQIQSLQSQLAQAQKKAKSSSSAKTFKVPELGIQFTPSSDLSDLIYTFDNSTDSLKGYALFSTKSLVNSGGATCVPGGTSVPGPLGSITLSSTPPPPSNSGADGTLGVYIKQVGSKYLYDQTPQSACSASAPAAPVTSFEDALKTATAL